MIIRIIAAIIATITFGTETPEEWAADRIWATMTDEQRYEASIDLKARAVGMTTEEFIFMSSVIEAESDRGNGMEGRILIATTIYNRQMSGDFPNTITGVLTQSGQFSVVSNGQASAVGRTNRSDWAIIEAHRNIANGNAPDVMYFNCIGYNGGFEAYGYVDGNYFMISTGDN